MPQTIYFKATTMQENKPIASPDEFIKRFIKAIQGQEEFILNATFIDNGQPHSVFLIGGTQVSAAVVNMQDANHKLIDNHLRGIERVEDGVKRMSREARKNIKLGEVNRRDDGGISIKLKRNDEPNEPQPTA